MGERYYRSLEWWDCLISVTDVVESVKMCVHLVRLHCKYSTCGRDCQASGRDWVRLGIGVDGYAGISG